MENPPQNLLKMSHGKSKQEVPCDILNAYKTPPSIKQIEKEFNEQNFFRKEKFFFKPFTPPQIENLINYLHTNKAAGIFISREAYKNCSWFFNSACHCCNK